MPTSHLVFRVLLFLWLTATLSCIHAFGQDSSYVVSEIKILGNKTTKAHIILRELPFKTGDTIAKKDLQQIVERSESNLFNTSLFNFISVKYVHSSSISFIIIVEERWYWWANPIFEIEEPNFNTWWKTKNLDRLTYGLFVSKENFRGRKENVIFQFQAGYTEKIEVKYAIPFINKKRTKGLSLSFNKSRNREINYDLSNNLRTFYRSTSQYVKNETEAKVNFELRPKLYDKHSLELKYNHIGVSDTVTVANPNFLPKNYSTLDFLSLSYAFRQDKRNNKAYPTKGQFIELKIVENGLGILYEKWLAMHAVMECRKFSQIKPRLFLAGSIKTRINLSQSVPFYLMEGLGYHNNFVRGYEFYVINGTDYALFKSQLRYTLMSNRIFTINQAKAFHKFNKIPVAVYTGIYFDAGYVRSSATLSENNPLNNTGLFGGGVSIDFVSYYDLVFRMEYSINRLQEHGLFLHFIAPI